MLLYLTVNFGLLVLLVEFKVQQVQQVIQVIQVTQDLLEQLAQVLQDQIGDCFLCQAVWSIPVGIQNLPVDDPNPFVSNIMKSLASINRMI